MSDCDRGCLLYGKHAPDCTCTHECPDHEHHCEGCLPREAEIGRYCQRCAFKLRDTITNIPPLISALYVHGEGRLAQPDRPNTGDPTRRATKVNQMSPSPALDAADEAARWLHAWSLALADELAERGPFEYRPNGVPEPNPLTEARYLTSRLAQLCATEWANEMNDEARQTEYTLERLSGSDDADQRIPTRCPKCNQKSLMRPNGEDYVVCKNKKCDMVWASAELGLLARVVNS